MATTPATYDTFPAGESQHRIAAAILLEAAQRIADKEHSRDDVIPGSHEFSFTVTGRAGDRDLTLSYAGTLNVDPNGVKTPATPYQAIAAFLLGKMNESTRATCLTAIAAGEFAADELVKGSFEAACKQWREASKARDPQTQRGNVKPVYRAVESVAAPSIAADTSEDAEQPAAVAKPRRTRKAG